MEHGNAFAWENLVNDKKFASNIRARDKLSKEEKFLVDIFQEFVEISNSYSCLKNVEIYIRRFPYGPLGISKVDYLRYTIENYLHEIYILRERLKTSTTRIERMLRKIKKPLFDSEIFNTLKKDVISSFENIARMRSGHVHLERFSTISIDNLVTIELLSRGDMLPAKALYQQKCKQVRKKWTGIIKKVNNSIESMLDDYFDTLYKELFTKSGKLKLK